MERDIVVKHVMLNQPPYEVAKHLYETLMDRIPAPIRALAGSVRYVHIPVHAQQGGKTKAFIAFAYAHQHLNILKALKAVGPIVFNGTRLGFSAAHNVNVGRHFPWVGTNFVPEEPLTAYSASSPDSSASSISDYESASSSLPSEDFFRLPVRPVSPTSPSLQPAASHPQPTRPASPTPPWRSPNLIRPQPVRPVSPRPPSPQPSIITLDDDRDEAPDVIEIDPPQPTLFDLQMWARETLAARWWEFQRVVGSLYEVIAIINELGVVLRH